MRPRSPGVAGSLIPLALVILTATATPGSLPDPQQLPDPQPPASSLTPSITVDVPNGGEIWVLGTREMISWHSQELDEPVRIEVQYGFGGPRPLVVAESTPNDGAFIWTVAGLTTDVAKVQISGTELANIYDRTDGLLTIRAGTTTVDSPDGGENWEIGSSQMILWHGDELEGSVRIDLSRDGGQLYETITGSTENDGRFLWTVSGPATRGALPGPDDHHPEPRRGHD